MSQDEGLQKALAEVAFKSAYALSNNLDTICIHIRLSSAEILAAEVRRLKARVEEIEAIAKEIQDKWVPALFRDALEADKTLCNAGSIRSLLVRHGIRFKEAVDRED